MMIQIFGTAKCFDTKKAQRYFRERKIPFQMINLMEKGMSPREFRSVLQAVGSLDSLIDTASSAYSSFAYLSDEDKAGKLLEVPSLFKTPIVRNGTKAAIGYVPDIWKQWDKV